jgi:hypothetical protein
VISEQTQANQNLWKKLRRSVMLNKKKKRESCQEIFHESLLRRLKDFQGRFAIKHQPKAAILTQSRICR